jgi:hypothetical protein
MQDDMIESEISKPKGRLPQGLRIDRRQILLIAFVIITIILAVIFPFIGLKMQLVLILLPLAVVMGVWILFGPTFSSRF